MNYAATVKLISPYRLTLMGDLLRYMRTYTNVRYIYSITLLVDMFIQAAYFILRSSFARVIRGQTQRQSRAAQGAGCPQSTPRTCQSLVVPGRHVLRPSRPSAGEVRDAALGRTRRPFKSPSGCAIWFLSPNILSSQGRVRRSGFNGIVTPSARTEECPQTRRRHHDLHRHPCRRGRTDTSTQALPPYRTTVRYTHPPAKHRASTAAEKKPPRT